MPRACELESRRAGRQAGNLASAATDWAHSAGRRRAGTPPLPLLLAFRGLQGSSG